MIKMAVRRKRKGENKEKKQEFQLKWIGKDIKINVKRQRRLWWGFKPTNC